jgi:DNA-directed RNA polymerase subunit omega
MSLTQPRVDKLLGHTDTHYAAVLVAAKRARQINAYYHSLSEGAYGEYTPPMVEVPSGNYLTIALEETAAGKLNYEYKS